MKCSKCNHEMTDEMLFCGYCGNPVDHSFGTKQFDVQMDELLNEIEDVFPEHIISEASWNHARWDSRLKHICSELGYHNPEDFLTDCGFTLQFRLNELSPNMSSYSATRNRSQERTKSRNNGRSIDKVHAIWVPINISLLMAVLCTNGNTARGIFLILLVFSVLFWLFYLLTPRCPICNQKVWVEISRDFIRSEHFTKTKTVEDKVYGHSKNSRYPDTVPSYTIRRTVNIRAKRNYYNATYKCKECGYIRTAQISEVIELE